MCLSADGRDDGRRLGVSFAVRPAQRWPRASVRELRLLTTVYGSAAIETTIATLPNVCNDTFIPNSCYCGRHGCYAADDLRMCRLDQSTRPMQKSASLASVVIFARPNVDKPDDVIRCSSSLMYGI